MTYACATATQARAKPRPQPAMNAVDADRIIRSAFQSECPTTLCDERAASGERATCVEGLLLGGGRGEGSSLCVVPLSE